MKDIADFRLVDTTGFCRVEFQLCATNRSQLLTRGAAARGGVARTALGGN
jgi:hypothetical protein